MHSVRLKRLGGCLTRKKGAEHDKMTKYKIIVNPVAGRGAGEEAIPRIRQQLEAHDLDYDIVLTERPWHATELAEEAARGGFDVVVAVGGDGTANEVLNGLMQARQSGAGNPAMGILCVGRGNDFAYGAGVPHDLSAGCRALAKLQKRTIDVGRVFGGLYPEGRYFGNGVGIGFDAVVGFEAAKMKHLRGFLSYLVAALRTIFLYFHAPLVQIEYGEQTHEKRALLVSVMNGRRLGGGFMMAPKAQIDDGLFDLCIASDVSRPRIFALIPRFMKGTQASQPEITTDRTPHLIVSAVEGVLPAHSDGETLCTQGESLEMELLPGQIEIVCGSQEHER